MLLFKFTRTGKKAGYLGSAYFVGSFTGSLLWGWISDKIGRRPVLLMGMLGTLATELLFGFSQNFAWAIAARFLWGLLNGNLGVAKTYISEVSYNFLIWLHLIIKFALFDTVGRVLIAWSNDCILGKSGQITNPIIVVVGPVLYYSICAHLCL